MDTKKLRQKILDLAIHGKLVPQDPNDEPASVLLERIRAEKERLIKEGKIKRSKKSASDTPHYENRQVGEANEVPFEVPEGWEWCTIDDIAKSNIGLTYKPSDISNEGVPVYRSNNIQNRSICLDDVVRVDTQILEKQYLHESDLLICARNGSRNLVGKCALIPKLSEPTTFGAFMAVCRSSYNKWIFLLLNSDYFDAYLDDSNSTAINQVTQKMLLAFQMPFPPVNEQDRIYNEVCKWFSVIDILEFEERDLKLSIEKAKSKILDLAIHGKLVPQDPNDEPAIELLKRINPKFVPCDNAHYENVPEGWCTICVGDLAEYTNGKAFKPSDWERKGLPIIRIQNLNDENCQYNYTSITHEEKYRISHGDLLFAWAASLGVYIWQGNKAWLNQHIFKVDPHPFIDIQYLYYIFEYLVSEFHTRSHGSGMVHITKKEFETTIALLPPLSEQRRIVKSIKSYYTTLDNIGANL